MSNDMLRADQIAFHFYTKLFSIVNDARATEGPKSHQKVDKWFNLETPDSDLFTKESREPYRNISQNISTGFAPLQIQVVLSVPELSTNQVLVSTSPDSSRVRIEPTPKFIVLETWTLECTPHRAGYDDHLSTTSMDSALPVIYKHGIILFRSIYSLLRIQPAWKFHKRLRRRKSTGNRYGNLSILLRVKSPLDRGNDPQILEFNSPPSPHNQAFTTSTHTFSPISHILGIFNLSTTYLDNPNFQLDELESLLSSRFISLDRQEFVPTLEKNRQRDSISGSSLPSSTSAPKSGFSRSPPLQIARATSTGGVFLPAVDNISVAERFALPPAIGTSASTGSSALIPPPRPFPIMSPPSSMGLPISRLRRESMNSSSSSLISNRENILGTTSLSSSPSTGPLLIRKPSIFKANTISSASSPSLSIRQGVPSSLSREGLVPGSGTAHSRQSSYSPIVNAVRLPPSPIGSGTPSSFGDKRLSTSGTTGDSDRDRRTGVNSIGFATTMESQEVGSMPVPQRKRYSSSFGHRYSGSAGSRSGSPAGTSTAVGPSATGISTGQSPARTSAIPSGRNTPAGVSEGKEVDPTSFLGSNPDEDDISIFVQNIDSRKPLSGRVRQDVLGEPSRQSRQGQGHDRDFPERGKARESDAPLEHRRHGLADGYSTFPVQGIVSLPREASMPSNAVTSSTSPPRGLMLTSQGEVNERLTQMKETFLKSLEGVGKGNGVRRKDKEKEKTSPTTTVSSSKTSSTVTHFVGDTPPAGSVSGQDNISPLASRGMSLGYVYSSPEQEHIVPGPYDFSSGSELGIGRRRYDSTGSMLGNSEVGMSQGSEEVIGRMDLYDRRTGYQG